MSYCKDSVSPYGSYRVERVALTRTYFSTQIDCLPSKIYLLDLDHPERTLDIAGNVVESSLPTIEAGVRCLVLPGEVGWL